MNTISALVLASLLTVQPPLILPQPSAEATVAGTAVAPDHDATAIDRFVVETAARYAGN